MFCHSQPEHYNFGFKPSPSSFGGGHNHSKLLTEVGFELPDNMALFVPNITPFALSEWTDGEIFRAITGGIGRDGSTLFPMMPYEKYRSIALDDVKAIIAYIRTLEPVEKVWPRSSFSFPIALILRTMPRPFKGPDRFDGSNSVARGKYLTTIAGCVGCHTPMKGDGMMDPPDKDKEWAGGQTLPLKTGGRVSTANLTPDRETGIGNWSKESFIMKFKAFEQLDTLTGEARHLKEMQSLKIKDGDFQSIMSWQMYSAISEEDLGHIYEFLMSLEPIENKVEKFIN